MEAIHFQDLENRIINELERRRQVVHDLKQQLIRADRDVDFMVKVLGQFSEHKHLILTARFITCDRARYFLESGKHTGKGLRRVFNVDADRDLWGKRDKDDALISDDDAQIDVEVGATFYTTSKKIND